MDTFADIVADTKRYLAEAEKTLIAVESGARLAPGMTKDEAIAILRENIALYRRTLQRYDWRKKDA